jgi:hypothetical protein
MKQIEKKVSYTEFVKSGGEVFPKDMYPVKKTSVKKIKYNL